MPWIWLLLIIINALLILILSLFVRLVLRARRSLLLESAAARFLRQREHLEADFLHAAAHSGKPRGLRWKSCEWAPEIVFARDKKSRDLTALVGVTIQFEAVPGSDMEDLPAVGNLRHATGVFFLSGRQWRTTGRAVFNLNPAETLEHFKQQYERVKLT